MENRGIDSAVWNEKRGNKESETEEEKDGKYELIRWGLCSCDWASRKPRSPVKETNMYELSSYTFVMRDKEKAFSPLMHNLRLCTIGVRLFSSSHLRISSYYLGDISGSLMHEPNPEEFLPVMFLPQVSTWLILSLYFRSPLKNTSSIAEAFWLLSLK